jgi:hypothetical protein
MKVFKKALVVFRIVKQNGTHKDGTPVLNGLNSYNPLSYVFLIILSPFVLVIEGAKAVGVLWSEAW